MMGCLRDWSVEVRGTRRGGDPRGLFVNAVRMRRLLDREPGDPYDPLQRSGCSGSLGPERECSFPQPARPHFFLPP